MRVILPPVLLQLTDEVSASDQATDNSGARSQKLSIPKPENGSAYPIVGVIDSGVSAVLDDWVVDRFDYLAPTEYDPAHGTGVAGLIAMGQLANDPSVTPEANGCRIYDAPLYPKGSFIAKYSKGFSDFLEELEQAVSEAEETHGVRIFNLSINAVADVERHRYSIYDGNRLPIWLSTRRTSGFVLLMSDGGTTR